MRPLPSTLALILISSIAAAQDRPPPALLVPSGETSKPLLLRRVGVEARILGNVAETRMTLTFGNPLERAVAGDLYVPLPEGAVVSGYALDVEGVMVDGVVVEKDKARQVFEAEVRKGIDPGLVEWTRGNTFKTRVFPIPAGGSRTVMVRWVSDVLPEGGAPRYRLPLDFRDPVEEMLLRVEVVKPGRAPVVEAGGPAGIRFQGWRDSFVAEATVKGATLTEDLVIRLPEAAPDAASTEIAPDGTCYAHLLDVPRPPDVDPGAALRRVQVLWDASGSRGACSREREIRLLGQWLKGLPGTVTVDLVLFRNVAEAPRRFPVKNGDAEALLAALASVAYDGGTQLSAISPAPGVEPPDLHLLFSDGLSTFGIEEPAGFQAPVFVLSDDTAANHPLLHHIALSTGGAFMNLRRMDDAAVLEAIGRTPFSFLRVEVVSGVVEDVQPDRPRAVTGPFPLAAVLRSDTAEVVVHYGYGGRSLVQVRHRLSRAAAAAGTLLQTAWAQQRIQGLLALPERNRDELIRIGRRFGLVTPGTSLLVLERLEQYVEHRVPPPESLPELRREYFEIVEQAAKAEEERLGEKKERILPEWTERVEWWGQVFKYPKGFRIPPAPADGSGEGGSGMGIGSGGAGVAREMRMLIGSVEEPATSAPAAEAPPPPSPGEEAEKKEEKNGGAAEDEPAPPPEIAITPWDPETPYLKALKAAKREQYLETYLEQRKVHGTSPAFFLDCADFLYREKQDRLALQVLSNVAELELANDRLLRVLGHRLAQQGELALAKGVFEEVLRLRPEEPQSYRDLALVLDRLEDHARAMELLWHVVIHDWDRFDGIEIVALMELNRVIARAKRAGTAEIPVDPRFVRLLDTDIRIVLTWDTDLTDMDLWVTEPSGEKAFYSNNRTTIGGLVSRDFTQGYGPEEYLLKKRMPGVYRIEANYYGTSSPELTGPTTLQVEIFTNFGRPDEERKAITLRLEGAKDVVHVGDVTF